MHPTPEAYSELQRAYEHFNEHLFAGALPTCLITLQRKKRTYGYYSSERFAHYSGTRVDEIAMNPSYFSVRPPRVTLSTLVHEMTHAQQFHQGTPGRRGYHNKEWAELMKAVGLMPSSTGEPGGKQTGEHVTHYIVEGGPFDRACAQLLTEQFRLSWFDRFPPIRPRPAETIKGQPDSDTSSAPPGTTIDPTTLSMVSLPPENEGTTGVPANRSNRVKFRCPVCGSQAWGKPSLTILCGADGCDGAAFEPAG